MNVAKKEIVIRKDLQVNRLFCAKPHDDNYIVWDHQRFCSTALSSLVLSIRRKLSYYAQAGRSCLRAYT